MFTLYFQGKGHLLHIIFICDEGRVETLLLCSHPHQGQNGHIPEVEQQWETKGQKYEEADYLLLCKSQVICMALIITLLPMFPKGSCCVTFFPQRCVFELWQACCVYGSCVMNDGARPSGGYCVSPWRAYWWWTRAWCLWGLSSWC